MRGIVLAVTLATTTTASAAPEVVVVVSMDDAFRGALGDALAPANMTVIAANDPPPSVVELSIASRQIAEREQATSTVWLIDEASRTTLVAYDRDVDRMLVREVPYASPLDPAQAAETARMARTMLRALRLTPEIDLPPPHVNEARMVRANAVAPAVAPRSRELAASASLGVRVGAPASDAGLDPMLAVTWHPDDLGLGLQLRVAPRADLSTNNFTGRVADDSIAVTAHVPLSGAPKLPVIAFGGATLHRIVVDGRLAAGMDVSEPRFDPAARLGVMASYELTDMIQIGLVMSVDFLLRRQQYETKQEELLVVPRLQLSTGVVVSLRIL